MGERRGGLAARSSTIRRFASSISARLTNYASRYHPIAAFEAGKIVACEKPMAMNGAEAARMAEAARKSGQINTVWFNYRRVPAIAFAR